MPDTNRYIACAISIAVLLLVTSCHEGSHNESAPAATTSAAEDIASADQLYSQREDLMQLRRGIVSLRQALTKDPGNYDAAWKLAKV